jgi:hypothetical protein
MHGTAALFPPGVVTLLNLPFPRVQIECLPDAKHDVVEKGIAMIWLDGVRRHSERLPVTLSYLPRISVR